MRKTDTRVFPKVFKANKTQKIFFKCSRGMINAAQSVTIKIQPMEIYGVAHTEKYRIDEETRYPYEKMLREREGLYSIEYAFAQEQKYDVKVECDGVRIYRSQIYAVREDLIAVNGYKGDTHLHTSRSDGEGEPFSVGCAYRAAGYDFIAITDHHKYAPSIEGKQAFEALTDEFTVFRGEEVHNKGMGYFHVINFDGDSSVNEIIETKDEYVESEIARIMASVEFDGEVSDRRECAYRIFIAEQIRKANGVAIMAHPYWTTFGEYHMPEATTRFLLKNDFYDALELIAACDRFGHNGSNIQIALWEEMREAGVSIPVLGASDAHTYKGRETAFNKQYSIVFAKGKSDVKDAIRRGDCVAVLAIDPVNYLVFGQLRLVKYARFLLGEYFPKYQRLTKAHAAALMEKNEEKIAVSERKIKKYREEFFAW